MVGPGILLVCIFVPIVGAIIVPFLGKINTGLRNISALVFVLISFISAACALPAALNGTPLVSSLELPLGFSFSYYGDALAVFMAMTSSLVAAIIVFYSFGYI